MTTKVYSIPLLSTAKRTANNGISQVVLNFAKHLPAFGYEVTENPHEGGIFAHHAGEGGGHGQVAICHGLHPTARHDLKPPSVLYQINANVIKDIVGAQRIIVPSEWVADILRRDMHLSPDVIHWGVNLDEWGHDYDPSNPYVLWNKNRHDPICDPHWLNEVAKLIPRLKFKTTFGTRAANVEVLGRQYRDQMIPLIRRAGVYLATTKETGDIGSREALACGVPVVAFAQGATLDVVQHGVNGYLVPTGDVVALADGIKYCFDNREVLSQNALQIARGYGWKRAVSKVARVFDEVISKTSDCLVSVIVPCYNYGDRVTDAIRSVAMQETTFPFEIIAVNDGSTDNSVEVLYGLSIKIPNLTVIYQDNQGVAAARNNGIKAARGEYILCLDADDKIEQGLLQELAVALDGDKSLGIAYSALQLATGGQTGWPPSQIDYDKQFSGGNQIPTCCMFRRDDWQRVGGYRAYMTPAEDADLFTRLVLFTGRQAKMVTQEPLFVYSVHQGSLTNVNRTEGKKDPFMTRGAFEMGRNRPLAAPLKAGNRMASQPVRDYDNPLVDVEIVGDDEPLVLLTIDSLENQSFKYWRLIGRKPTTAVPFAYMKPELPAPFVMRVKAGTWITERVLENQLQQEEIPPYDDETYGVLMMCNCNSKAKPKEVFASMNGEEFIKVVFISGGKAKNFVPSPTGKKIGDMPATRAYGRRRQGDVFRVHKDDVAKRPDWFRPVAESSDIPLEAAPVITPPPLPELIAEKESITEPPPEAPVVKKTRRKRKTNPVA